VIDGGVTGEDAPFEEVFGCGIDGELEIAEEESVGDALVEGGHEVIGVDDADDALEFGASHEAEGDGGDDAEEAVSTDGELEEIGIFRAAAGEEFAAGVDDAEGLDVVDDRFEGEAAAVNVGTEGAAEAEVIGAGLFLDDPPGVGGISLGGYEVMDEFGPLDAGFDFDETALAIEGDDAVQGAGVEVNGIFAELLAAHGVASPGDAELLVIIAGAGNEALDIGGCIRGGDLATPVVLSLEWMSLRTVVAVREGDLVGERMFWVFMSWRW
jgi:hypothetical protein